MGKFVPKGMENINMPVVLAVAGLITLIVFFVMLLPDKKGSTEEIRILEGRVASLERHLKDVEESSEQRFSNLEKLNMQMGTFAQDAERILAMPADIDNIHSKLENLDKRQGNLEKKVSGTAAPSAPARPSAPLRSAAGASDSAEPAVSSKPAAVAAPAASAPASGKTPVKTVKVLKKPGKATYHRVEEGENLYTIANRYNISVEDLLHMNRLPPETTLIHVGQKLYIGR